MRLPSTVRPVALRVAPEAMAKALAVPTLTAPVPVSVWPEASVKPTRPGAEASKVPAAPTAMVAGVSSEPKAERASVPPRTPAVPVRALAESRVSVPLPVLVRVPEPDSECVKVTSLPLVLMVPVLPAATVRPLETSSLLPVANLSVALPVKVRPVEAASVLVPAISSVPWASLKPPVKALVAESVSVPLPVLAKLPAPLSAEAKVTSLPLVSIVPVLPAAATSDGDMSVFTPVAYLRVALPVKVSEDGEPKLRPLRTPAKEFCLAMVSVPSATERLPEAKESRPSRISSPLPFLVNSNWPKSAVPKVTVLAPVSMVSAGMAAVSRRLETSVVTPVP